MDTMLDLLESMTKIEPMNVLESILADDEYNSAWKYGCKDAGYMPNECQYFKNHPDDLDMQAYTKRIEGTVTMLDMLRAKEYFIQ
jgi:hypothetical protein